MYKTLFLLSLTGLTLCTCKPTPRSARPTTRPAQQEQTAADATTPPASAPIPPNQADKGSTLAVSDPAACLLTVDVTIQDYNRLRPWEKQQPDNTRLCGVYLGEGKVLTYGGPLATATYVEIGLPDGSRAVPARVLKYDEALQLGILGVVHEEDKDIFDTRKAYPTGSPMQRGDEAELWCTLRGTEPLRVPLKAESGEEDDGMPRLLMRADQAVPGGFAFGAPIMKEGKLAGISAGYNQQARQVLAINAELLARMLGQDKESAGVPVLGIRYEPLTDPVFRRYLKLPPSQSGVYIGTVHPGSAAEKAGLQEGDVLTAIEGIPVDNQGRCHLPLYGQISVGSVSRYLKPLGENLQLTLCRAGEELLLSVPLNRDAIEKALMPEEKEGEAPRYIIWGGMVFQPLTATYLGTLKEGARNTLPVEFLELENRKEELTARGYTELTGLTLVLPTPATLGYDAQGFCLVEKVNGKEAHNFAEFARLLDEPTENGLVELTLNKAPYTLYLDRATAEACNDILRRQSIPHLRRLEKAAPHPGPAAENTAE